MTWSTGLSQHYCPLGLQSIWDAIQEACMLHILAPYTCYIPLHHWLDTFCMSAIKPTKDITTSKLTRQASASPPTTQSHSSQQIRSSFPTQMTSHYFSVFPLHITETVSILHSPAHPTLVGLCQCKSYHPFRPFLCSFTSETFLSAN